MFGPNRIIADGTKLHYKGLPGVLTNLPNEEVSISFTDVPAPTAIMNIDQLTKRIGKTIVFVDHREAPQNPKALTPDEIAIKAVREFAISELELLVGKNNVGGRKKREKAIQNAIEKAPQAGFLDYKAPSPATLGRWARDKNEHIDGVLRSVRAPRKKKTTTFSQEIIDFAITSIDRYYLTKAQPTYQLAYDCFIDEALEEFGKQENLPCYNTFCTWIKNLDPDLLTATRFGNKALRESKRRSLKKHVIDHILERVEIDAVHLAVGIVDDEGNYLGPVTLFVAIDCLTRAILGFEIQIGRGESSASYIQCIKHSFTPKDLSHLPEQPINIWFTYGVPEKIHGDGGTGVCSIETISFAHLAGCKFSIEPTGKGWKKPFIESFFATLRKQFAKTLRGYAGKIEDQKKRDNTLQQEAVLTKGEFEQLLTIWIVDEYHQTSHSGLERNPSNKKKHLTPAEAWQEQIELGYAPMLPPNFEQLQYVRGQEETRKVLGDACHKGISFENIIYNDETGRLRQIGLKLRQIGEVPEVSCQFSPNNISCITARDPFTDELFELPTFDERVYEGMTLGEFKAKYPSTYVQKGYGHKRRLRNSTTQKETEAKHAKKTSPKPKKSRTSQKEKLTERVKNHKTAMNNQAKGNIPNNNQKEQKSEQKRKEMRNKFKAC